MFDSIRDKNTLVLLGSGGFSPSLDELSMSPVVDDWCIKNSGMYAGSIVGRVTGHPVLDDGPVTTTEPQAADVDAGWVRTRNTLYRLGTHLGDRHE